MLPLALIIMSLSGDGIFPFKIQPKTLVLLKDHTADVHTFSGLMLFEVFYMRQGAL